MDFFRIVQIVYALLFFFSTGILAFAVLTVISWPQIRGRRLLVTAIAVRLLAMAGYLVMGLVQLVSFRSVFEVRLPTEVMQGMYMLLAVTSLIGDGLLLLSLISLARALREIQLGGGLINSEAADPFKKW